MGRKLTTSNGNDIVYTPGTMADEIVKHFKKYIDKKSLICEPCEGGGAFTRAFKKNRLKNTISFDLQQGCDFFDFHRKVDWIITNPPWGIIRKFARHSYQCADNIVLLCAVNAFGFTARIHDYKEVGFGIKEIVFFKNPPKPWPQGGIQLGAVYLKRGWFGRPQTNTYDYITNIYDYSEKEKEVMTDVLAKIAMNKEAT